VPLLAPSCRTEPVAAKRTRARAYGGARSKATARHSITVAPTSIVRSGNVNSRRLANDAIILPLAVATEGSGLGEQGRLTFR
jgi:hypothetical protein